MEKTVPELVEQLVKGDQSAFAELVRRYQKKLYSLAYQMLGNHLDADEVVQESFVRVYNRREGLGSVANFTSFLIRIATNYSIDLLRKRRVHAEVTDDPETLPGEIQIHLAGKVKTPGDVFQDKVIMSEVKSALEKLPPRQKITTILHDIEGYSKSEIAEILECPEATVRSNLHIARGKLKKILEKRLTRKEQK
jgi:RNA polymerase sigma-70 factor (ECF subfamily)